MNAINHIRSIAALRTVAIAAFATAASLASAVDVILVASAPTTVAMPATPQQELETIQVSGGYDADTRRELLSVARYPNNPDARQQRLQGKVGIAFEIDRQGVLRNADIVQSSRSKALDTAALASVHWAKFAAFPANLSAGEQGRRYTVTFDFRLADKD